MRKEKKSRQVILIMTDSQRADMVGSYGNMDMPPPVWIAWPKRVFSLKKPRPVSLYVLRPGRLSLLDYTPTAMESGQTARPWATI